MNDLLEHNGRATTQIGIDLVTGIALGLSFALTRGS